MPELRYSPRRVYLPMPVPDDVADALRAAGHGVLWGSVEAFNASDTLVIGEASTSAFFFVGAAVTKRRLVLVLTDAPGTHPLAGYATATASTLDELVDLLGRWDPVALAFDAPIARGT